MRNMKSAPLDGTRILLKYTLVKYQSSYSRHDRHLGPMGARFRSGQWVDSGEKWEEMHWVNKKEETGSDPHWEPWGGSYNSHSTHHVFPDKCLGWLPLPKEK